MRRLEQLKADISARVPKFVQRAARRIVAAETLPGAAEKQALTPEQLEELAFRFPQWTILAGIEDGKPVKVYMRSLDDFHPERFDTPYTQDDATEFLAADLKEMLDAYNCGVTYGSKTEDTDSAHCFFYASDPSAITLEDIGRLEGIESYLAKQGFGNDPEIL